jgi:hypothetical protein
VSSQQRQEAADAVTPGEPERPASEPGFSAAEPARAGGSAPSDGSGSAAAGPAPFLAAIQDAAGGLGSQPGPQPGGSQAGGSQAGGSQAGGKQPGGLPAGSSQPSYGSRPPTIRPLWKAKPDGITTFRHSAPLVLWWAWVVFLLINLFDVATSHLGIHSARVTAVLLVVTGVMYACTVHSRVDCDDEGVTIYNPVRDHDAPWGAVESIHLGDSVEFSCHQSQPKEDKTIYSWALYSRRRSRARMQMQSSFLMSSRRISERAPKEAADLAKQQASQLMAAELGKRATDARAKGAADGFLRSRWSWPPLAAIVLPVVLLLVTLLVR